MVDTTLSGALIPDFNQKLLLTELLSAYKQLVLVCLEFEQETNFRLVLPSLYHSVDVYSI